MCFGHFELNLDSPGPFAPKECGIRFFKNPEMQLDDNRTIAPQKGGILVVGIHEDKSSCCALIKHILAELRCDFEVVPQESLHYFYLSHGLAYVKGVVQFPLTIKGTRKGPKPARISQQMESDLTEMCKKNGVPFLPIHYEYESEPVAKWLKSNIHVKRPVSTSNLS